MRGVPRCRLESNAEDEQEDARPERKWYQAGRGHGVNSTAYWRAIAALA